MARLRGRLNIDTVPIQENGEILHHYMLMGRDAPDQHTISSITGLQERLDSAGDSITSIQEDLNLAKEELESKISQSESHLSDLIGDTESRLLEDLKEVETSIQESLDTRVTQSETHLSEIIETTESQILGTVESVEVSLREDISGKADKVPGARIGALLVADESGGIECCGITPDEIAPKNIYATREYVKSLLTETVQDTVEITESGETKVQIPLYLLEGNDLCVFQNGMLLAKDIHYTIEDGYLSLIGQETYEGDIFTFICHGSQFSAYSLTPDEPVSDHTHGNKDILDSITQDKVNKWDNSLLSIFVNGEEVPTLDNSVELSVPVKPEDIGAAKVDHSHEDYLRSDMILGGDGLILPSLLPAGSGGSLTLGDTADTAFRGDYGTIAYEHSLEAHAPPTAQANVIESIQLAQSPLLVTGKSVNIPVAGLDTFGVVKSSTGVNKVYVEDDGTLSIKEISIDSLVNDGKEITLNAGDALSSIN